MHPFFSASFNSLVLCFLSFFFYFALSSLFYSASSWATKSSASWAVLSKIFWTSLMMLRRFVSLYYDSSHSVKGVWPFLFLAKTSIFKLLKRYSTISSFAHFSAAKWRMVLPVDLSLTVYFAWFDNKLFTHSRLECGLIIASIRGVYPWSSGWNGALLVRRRSLASVAGWFTLSSLRILKTNFRSSVLDH